MSSQKNQKPNKAWAVFEKRYAGNPFLIQDPLYSMEEDVIAAISKGLPGFFTEEDLRFERDLARITGGGFFLRHPIGYPVSPLYEPGLTVGEFLDYQEMPPSKEKKQTKRLNPSVKPERFKNEAGDQASRMVEDFTTLVWEKTGTPPSEIKAAVAQAQDEERLISRWPKLTRGG